MTTTPSHPGRVRLYGGRNTHAARETRAAVDLACDAPIDPMAANHWMPGTATITCRGCAAVATPPGPNNGGAA